VRAWERVALTAGRRRRKCTSPRAGTGYSRPSVSGLGGLCSVCMCSVYKVGEAVGGCRIRPDPSTRRSDGRQRVLSGIEPKQGMRCTKQALSAKAQAFRLAPCWLENLSLARREMICQGSARRAGMGTEKWDGVPEEARPGSSRSAGSATSRKRSPCFVCRK
jgi:hypothetical protein